MNEPPVRRIARALLRHYDATRRAMPWRETSDPYAIWVSEVMLQQTRVDTVIPYWERWMARYPSVAALAEAEVDRCLDALADLAGLDDTGGLPIDKEDIISRADICRVFSDCLALPVIEVDRFFFLNHPTGGHQHLVDGVAGDLLWILIGHTGGRGGNEGSIYKAWTD